MANLLFKHRRRRFGRINACYLFNALGRCFLLLAFVDEAWPATIAVAETLIEIEIVKIRGWVREICLPIVEALPTTEPPKYI